MSFRLYLLFLAANILRPIEMFAPELAFLRVMVILSALTLMASAVEYARSKRFAAHAVHVKLVIGIVFALALSRVSVGWLGGVPASIGEFSLPLFLVMTTFVNVTTWDRLITTCKVFAYSIVALSALGAYSYHTGYMVEKLVLRQNVLFDDVIEDIEENAIPANETNPRYLWRLHSLGLLQDPNDFGQALVVALPLLYGLGLKGRFFRSLWVSYLPIAVCLYAVALTHSRGALLGVASLLFFGVRNYLGTVRTTVMLVLGAAAAMALNLTGGRGYSANEESAGGRIDAWSEGLRMLASHPILGVGHGRFTEHHLYTAHNSFVLTFAEIGLVGYFVWLGLIVLAYKGLARVIDLSSPMSKEQKWATLLRSSLVGFLTCAFFLSKAFDPMLYFLLGCAIVTYWLASRSRGGGSERWVDQRVPWRATTLLVEFGSITLIYAIVLLKTATVGRSI